MSSEVARSTRTQHPVGFRLRTSDCTGYPMTYPLMYSRLDSLLTRLYRRHALNEEPA
jgi:hypothetical protein